MLLQTPSAGILRSRRRRGPLDRRQTLGHNLLSGLVAHWPLDDAITVGTTSQPQRELHGGYAVQGPTFSNGPSRTSGVAGKLASQFTSASSNYLLRTSEAALQCGDIEFACSAWVYLDSLSSTRVIMGKDNNSAGGREWTFYSTAANNPRFIAFDGTSVVGSLIHSTTLTTGTWYFLLGYHSAASNQVGLSVNGAAFETAATTGAPATTSTEFRIGADARGSSPPLWDGRIQMPTIWKNTIPTADDALYLYNGGFGRPYPFV